MVKRVFKKVVPGKKVLEKHGKLHWFGEWIHEPNLWHISRRSTPGGVANGLFWAFIPIPGQTILAIITATWFRVNIPISVLFAWMTNPITMYPLFYAAYKLGAFVVQEPVQEIAFEFSWNWVATTLGEIWLPLTIGCLMMGILCAAMGYLLVTWIWRWSASRKWQSRKYRAYGSNEGSSP